MNWGGSLFFSDYSWGRFCPLLWLPFCSGWLFVVALLLWAVIITVCEVARILSSRVEYLFALKGKGLEEQGSQPKAFSEVL